MAFPVSVARKERALVAAETAALNLKIACQQASANFASGSRSANEVLKVLNDIRTAISIFDTSSAVAGIAGYAQDQRADPSLNIAAEFTTMRNAAVDARDWIITNFPKSATPQSGYLLKETIDVNGDISTRTFSPAETAGLRAKLDAVVATIA